MWPKFQKDITTSTLKTHKLTMKIPKSLQSEADKNKNKNLHPLNNISLSQIAKLEDMSRGR